MDRNRSPRRRMPRPAPRAHLGTLAAGLLAALRERQPVVHHLANFVTMGDVASATRAVGARPVMAMAQDEIDEVVRSADVLVINLGTPTPDRLAAVHAAVQAARRRVIPIVIDPVGAGLSKMRREAAAEVVRGAGRPIVRCNAAEAYALAGLGGRARGAEAEGGHDAMAAVSALTAMQAVAAITGPRDVIADGRRAYEVANGHPWLAAMPGAGCMATAVVGAFCGVADLADYVTATAAALACFGLAAERAAGRAGGPGTLKPALLDALFTMTPKELQAGARLRALAYEPARAGPQRVRRRR